LKEREEGSHNRTDKIKRIPEIEGRVLSPSNLAGNISNQQEQEE
jgi:hypothetical protein